MRVLVWNLFHGRAVPPARRDLRAEFATALRGWDWDVALLQEVPPWWPPSLALAGSAHQRSARTSRNVGLPLRRFVAERWPDVIKSNGGGANAILVRAGPILEHRVARLRWLPERRIVHGVRLGDGTWIANLHAQVHSERRAQADIATAVRALLAWAGDAPLVLGGDFNTRTPAEHGLTYVGGHGVDHVLARGLTATATTQVLDRGSLSDHSPVLVTLS
jgi:endonuclease/exonuclease/phosphatase family metal-dependent hydrolase